MAPKEAEAKAAAQEEADDGSSDGGFGICYVREKILKDLKEQVKAGKDITRETVDKLTADEDIDPEETMVPVDMAGLGDDIEDIDALMEKVGAKGVAEAFIAAEERFKANKDKMPADAVPQPMTAEAWKALAEADLEDMESEDLEDEEEEEELDDEDEEDGEAAEEPAAKKAKTS